MEVERGSREGNPMPKDYSPFTPGLPVPLEFFVGRVSEIERLRKKVAVAASGRLQVAFLSGERGIGKSSLASFVRFIVERDDQVLGLHTFLGGVTSLDEMVRRVFERLVKESVGNGWFPKVKEFFGNHIRQVGLFDVSVEFRAPEEDLQRLVRNFASALQNLMRRLEDEKKGLFVILDDINGLASSPDFANWLKSLVDEISTSRDSLPLCLLIVGLEERRQSLIGLNPSLARVFDVVDIRAWEKEETRSFYEKAFNDVGVSVDADALDLLVRFAGGLPVLAHEIGEAVFKADEDNRITRRDALQGIVTAADIVGQKHLEPRVFSAIRSKRYRTILRKFAAKQAFGESFRRRDLSKLLSNDEAKVLDNFITKMKKLGVITGDPEGGHGAYRFQNLLHHLYFYLDAGLAKGVEPT